MASSSSAPAAAKITEITETPPAELALGDLIPFIEATQASGALSLTDAYVVSAAIKFLSSDSDEEAQKEFLAQVPETQRKNPSRDLAQSVLFSTIARGLAKGAFTLSDAAKLAKMLKLVKLD